MAGIIEVDGKDAEYARAMFEILNLRMVNERLRAELAAIKPDWESAPDDAEYLVMDINGEWVWWNGKPCGVDTYGWTGGNYCMGVSLGTWRDTLECRPEEES